jgi:Asp/Glu/hydantoin racemase
MAPGSYDANYPGGDIRHRALFTLHSVQWLAHALNAEETGFDAFALCTMPDPLLTEIRSILDIAVVGSGESCFKLAGSYGQKFGMLLFIDMMAERYRQQIDSMGLGRFSVGVQPVGFGFLDVLNGFTNPGPLIDQFKIAAKKMIAQGADVIILGEIPLSLVLASEGITRIDDTPIMDSLAVTLKTAEMMVDLKNMTGLSPCRRGWSQAQPSRQRVKDLLKFYGMSDFLVT